MNFKITLMLLLSSFFMNAQTNVDEATWEYTTTKYSEGGLINYHDELIVLQRDRMFKISGDNEKTSLSGTACSNDELEFISIIYNDKVYYSGNTKYTYDGYLCVTDGETKETIDMIVDGVTYKNPNAFCETEDGKLMILAEKGEKTDAILIYDGETGEFTKACIAPGDRDVMSYPVIVGNKLCVCAYKEGDSSSTMVGFSFDGTTWTEYSNTWSYSATGFANKIYTTEKYFLAVLDLATDEKSYLKYDDQYLKPGFQTTGTNEYYVVDDEIYLYTETPTDEIAGPDASKANSANWSNPDKYKYILKINKDGEITKICGEKYDPNYWFYAYGFVKYGSDIYFQGRMNDYAGTKQALFRLAGDSFVFVDVLPADNHNFGNMFNQQVAANGALYSLMRAGSKGTTEYVVGWRIPGISTPVENLEADEAKCSIVYFNGELICDVAEPGELCIYNLNGSKVESINVGSGLGEYRCHLGTAGIYIAKFVGKDTGKTYVVKFVSR
jgi:hypothetical protein